jgi:exopolysaccharide biosynthesis polyprenyl glycosylphosphotransferase
MYNDKQHARRRLMLLMDALSITLSMLLAGAAHAALRSRFDIFKEPPSAEQYLLIAYVTMPMMLGLIILFGLHRQFERPFRPWRVLWDQFKLHGTGFIGVATLVFLTQMRLNRTLVGLFFVFTFTLMLVSRFLLSYWRRRNHATGQGRTHLLLISGDPNLTSQIIASARAEPLAPEFVGILGCEATPTGRNGSSQVPHLGTLEDLPRVLHEQTVDEVVLLTRDIRPEQFRAILTACDELGTPMRQLMLPEYHDGRRLGLDRQYGLPFVTLALSERSMEEIALKRAVDLSGSAAALLILSPLMLLIALLILVTMGRPVLHSQERIGYHGRRFRMHKFRSMVRDAEAQREALNHRNEMSGPVFKIAADPRVTRLGRVLRKFSLDELPQLFNVLGGSMSLVGPRPLPVAEQQQITGPLRRRLSMKPGITGLWQVSGRSDLSFDEWMKLDLEYVDTSSLRRDVELLLKTVPAVFSGRGAK